MTASQIVHSKLRNEIISMRRLPGEQINEMDIAKANGVSRTPVREALLRLAEAGLIEIVAKSGTVVSRIPADELPEAILARKALEQMVVRAAASVALNSDVLRMCAIVERQREALSKNDIDGFHDGDEALHEAIAETAGYPGFWRIIEQIKVQLDRYRRLTLPQSHRKERALAEHSELVDCIAAHEPERAAAIMGQHLDWLGDSLAEIREINPNFFSGDPETTHSRWVLRFAGSRNGVTGWMQRAPAFVTAGHALDETRHQPPSRS